MKLLLWVPPWAAHGDLNFYKNSVEKHLIPQGNILVAEGWDVTLFLPSHFSLLRAFVNESVNIIDFDFDDQIQCFGTLNDLSLELYKGNNSDCKDRIEKIAGSLSSYLDSDYDVIMLWETPVPFLEHMYPNSLIVNQMPGVFSRAPYPHMITFDIHGLYNTSTLTTFSKDIKKGVTYQEEAVLANKFIEESRVSLNALQPFSRKDLDPSDSFKKLVLLPLQVSAHYSFQSDTTYSNQMEFLLDVMKDMDTDTGVVVTQYVTPRVSDTILSADVIATLKTKWPNLIYKPIFDKVSSVSQFILPLIDEVVTCSSSLGLQALAWGRQLKVYGDTYLSPYSNDNCYLNYEDRNRESVNILSFLLARNQPLASVITKDGAFLSDLLNKLLVFKRSGSQNLSEMPSFLSIDPEYINKFMESFRMDRVLKDLSQLKLPIGRKSNEVERFNRFANDAAVKVISFDVFDTLVHRPTEVPIDFFKFLDKSMLRISDGVAENFSRIRQVSEIEARNEKESQEVTLDEIYEKIKDFYKLSDSIIESMKLAEINYELKMIKSRPAGRRLWNIALKTGKPIYIISDMYLPKEVIVKLLDINGFSGYQKLFLSNEYGCSKKEGELFDLILEELSIPADSLLHIGDNRVADSDQPKSRGIRCYRILRAIDRMRGSEIYSKAYPARVGNNELARSAIAGLTAQRLFDSEAGVYEKNSHFHGEPANLGYAGMGPFVTSFMLWLGRQAKRDNISHLYFLSREGWLLKQVYDVLHKDDPSAPRSTYLYASRRATRVASLRNIGDVIALSGHPFQAGVAVGDLLSDRFGINLTLISSEKWQEANFSGPEELLTADPSGRKKLATLCSVISDVILEHAESERTGYLGYINSTGLNSERNPAVVDLGWRANMQGALSNLIGKPLAGYYYATLQGTEIWFDKGLKCSGFMGDLLSANHPSAAVHFRPLLEYLVCHTESSLITMAESNGFKPIFRPESNIGLRRAFLELVHQGAVQFASDFIGNFKDSIEQLWIDPFLAEKVLLSFFQHPHLVDAQMFKDHAFEDALAGVKRKYIISPRAENHAANSVWKQGAAALYAQPAAAKKSTPQPAIVKKEPKKAIVVSEDINANVKYSWIRILERKIVKSFVSKKKFAKYQRDRESFFKDSKRGIAQKWYTNHKA